MEGKRIISEYVKRAGPNIISDQQPPRTVDTVSWSVADMRMFMLTGFPMQHESADLPVPTNEMLENEQ